MLRGGAKSPVGVGPRRTRENEKTDWFGFPAGWEGEGVGLEGNSNIYTVASIRKTREKKGGKVWNCSSGGPEGQRSILAWNFEGNGFSVSITSKGGGLGEKKTSTKKKRGESLTGGGGKKRK